MRFIHTILALSISCGTLHADSILFLPDSNRPAKAPQEDFGDVTRDSDLRLFDIQKKGFNPKNSDGFKVPEESTTTNVLPPQEMQQEELPREYSNAFETSMAQARTEPIILAQNTPKTQKSAPSTPKTIESIANGATFIAISSEANPKPITIQKKNFPWVAHPKDSSKKIAFVPINYRSELGTIKLNESLSLQVVQGAYKKEKITITDTSKTKPNKAANDRIAKEFAEANAIYKTYTKQRYWSTPFELPLQSVITSPFGSARVFNDEIKSFHGGTDFRAAIGTPIHASNDGVVVIAKDRFLAGKSVVLDHGEGIYSMYYHCSDIKVSLGQKVRKGQVVALSGDTGRVSGAHLHFGILVNGVQVDPIDFINKVNALF